VPPVQGPGGAQPQLVATPPPAQTGSGLPGSNPGLPPALATQASSTPIKAAFNTMVANPNNSSPSSGVAAMNGSSSVRRFSFLKYNFHEVLSVWAILHIFVKFWKQFGKKNESSFV
jgi:hypothetical protein